MKQTVKHRNWNPLQRGLVALLLCLALSGCESGPVTVEIAGPQSPEIHQGKVVFLAGRDSHGDGEHEHRAGSHLLAAALRERQPHWQTVNVYGGWPEDESVLEGANAIVMYCDGGRKHLINKHLDTFERLLSDAVGIIALHYCVEAPKGSPSATALLDAIGGYFETGWSVNPHWEAHFRTLPAHPVTARVKPFSQFDEWYFNMRFAPGGVTPVLEAIAPASTMARRNGPHSGNDAVRKLVAEGIPQVTAWAFERPGGGRGFGYTGGHFHSNWQHEQSRALLLNAIEWAANIQAPD